MADEETVSDADLAAREESARVAAEPNDGPMVSPVVPGDVIPETGRPEADVYPPSTVGAPRYDGPLASHAPEHWHAALITGEAQAGHQYPHGGQVREFDEDEPVIDVRWDRYRPLGEDEEVELLDRRLSHLRSDKGGVHSKAEATA